MTIIAETEPIATTVDEWCEQVRQLHDEHARPIASLTDPRVDEYRRAIQTAAPHPTVSWNFFTAAIEDNPPYAGELYFKHCIPLPATPIAGPDWASSHEVTITVWPQVEFDFKSEEITIGEVVAYANRMISIQVETSGDDLAGTVRNMTEESADVTLMVDGHPVDFYGASVHTLKQAAAALLNVAVKVGEGLSK